jgi:hypothetical protein
MWKLKMATGTITNKNLSDAKAWIRARVNELYDYKNTMEFVCVAASGYEIYRQRSTDCSEEKLQEMAKRSQRFWSTRQRERWIKQQVPRFAMDAENSNFSMALFKIAEFFVMAVRTDRKHFTFHVPDEFVDCLVTAAKADGNYAELTPIMEVREHTLFM